MLMCTHYSAAPKDGTGINRLMLQKGRLQLNIKRTFLTVYSRLTLEPISRIGSLPLVGGFHAEGGQPP